ncbi:MAG: NAD(P)H-binding protein, partial [Kordiimonadaceae bacterium]|nr:NAD(P)H-binding protein [Kordiimonadaceae bacterium]
MSKVLVYGGTGSQARPTVERLIEKGHQPIVVTRNASSAPDISGAKLVEGNMNDADFLRSVTAGVDAVAFLVPAFLDSDDDAVPFGRNAIYAAVSSGVKKFVWNASGPIPDDEN